MKVNLRCVQADGRGPNVWPGNKRLLCCTALDGSEEVSQSCVFFVFSNFLKLSVFVLRFTGPSISFFIAFSYVPFPDFSKINND